jgi:predicted permease
MFLNYFKIALRNLRRNKIFTFINVFGLAIGINACLIIFLIVNHELNHDTFHADKERIFRVVSHIHIAGETYKNPGVTALLHKAVREEITGIETVAAFHVMWLSNVWVNLSDSRRREFSEGADAGSKREVIVAEADYFNIFKYKWLAGSPKTALNEPFKVVLSAQKARKYFGNIAPDELIGRTITYGNFNDTITVSVSGIVEDWQQRTDFIFKDFISFATLHKCKWSDNVGFDSWGNTNSSSQMLVKLNPNTTPKQIESKLPALLRKYVKEKQDAEGRKFLLQPLRDIHFNLDFSGEYGRVAHLPTLYGLIGIGAFLLIIASINFINLTTAQASRRAKEIGIRKVLGGTKRRLIVQFLFEALILAILATILSLVIAEPMLWFFSDFVAEEVRFGLFQPEVLLFLIFIILTTTVLAGFYPSWVLSSLMPVASLKNQTNHKGTRKANLRKTLIVFQFACSQVFIMGAVVVGSQLRYMLHKDMGFRREAIVSFQSPWFDESNKKIVLLDKIKQIPEVALVSLSQSTPAGSGYSTTTLKYKPEGKNEIETNVHRKSADENYLKLYGIKLLAGRNVQKSDTIKEFLINETYAKHLGFRKPEEAVGQYLAQHNNTKIPIVGVFSDFNVGSLHQAIPPTFIACEDKYSSTFNLKIAAKGAHFQTAMQKIEKAYLSVFPNDKFNYTFLDAEIAKFYAAEQKTSKLITTATFIVIFISCIGLFGLVTFSVEARTKEIGIRKVLGATARSIVALISKDFLRLVVIAFLIAVPVAVYFSLQWLQNFAYRMDLSWWIFAFSGVLALLIALLTIAYQALSASIINPVESLRSE